MAGRIGRELSPRERRCRRQDTKYETVTQLTIGTVQQQSYRESAVGVERTRIGEKERKNSKEEKKLDKLHCTLCTLESS